MSDLDRREQDLMGLFSTIDQGLGIHKDWPVMDWNPTLCGEIDIVITHQGQWRHEGRPIARSAMIDLFAGLLKGGKPMFIF